MKLSNSFQRGRKFRIKIGSSYSPYLDLLVGVPHGSIRVFCFFINTCEIFMGLVFSKVEKDVFTVFKWHENNYLKANSGKPHL